MEAERQDEGLATLGGGCFWCLEAVFEQLKGVESVESGYAGGHLPDPTYEEVCSGSTGHAEVVQVRFDPAVLPYGDLLGVFFATHDPTTLNRQRAVAEALIQDLETEAVFDHPIVTEVAPLEVFYPAEAYHREYYRNNPNQGYCRAVISPKVAKFRRQYADRLKGE